MGGIEKEFNINMVLLTAYASLEGTAHVKNTSLVFDMDPTVPKELKGDIAHLTKLLTHLLTFIFEHTSNREIIFSMVAPKDFLYKESILFEIRDPGLDDEKLTVLFQEHLDPLLEVLNAEIKIEEDNPLGIHITIPFKLSELGDRRYYRLPDIGMMGKKVLLLSNSEAEAHSLQKMFKYFLYTTDVGLEEYKANGSDLNSYDILVIDEKLISETLEPIVKEVQKSRGLKYVILKEANAEVSKKPTISCYPLVKPLVQESVFELIVSLFAAEMEERTINDTDGLEAVDISAHILEVKDSVEEEVLQTSEHGANEDELGISDVVLDTRLGESNFKKINSEYKEGLREFMETFKGSDKYFRDIVTDKAVWQIKEFCIDLEKSARYIGALSIADIAAQVSLVFVYDQLDTLPVYVSKYHTELEKLIRKINIYLH